MPHHDVTGTNAPAAAGALSGYRVIDLAHHMAGPAATQKLGDFGADVIKVEPPGVGEWSRTRPIGDAWIGGDNTSFISLNRNKRSIGINLKDPDGYDLFCDLVRSADVLVINFRPEVCVRLKVDWNTLKAINPRLIYCSITGFGRTGPLAGRPGQDLIIQAYSGVAWNGGVQDGAPTAAAAFVADATTGNHAVIGILAALLSRERTGDGQQVEVNLLSSMMDVQIQELTTYLNTRSAIERPREPLAHPLANSPYGIHRTADGWIAVAMAEPAALAQALDIPELEQYGRWSDGQTHRDEIFRAVAHALVSRTTTDALETFDRNSLWSGRVNTYDDLVQDAQVLHNGMIQSITAADGNEINLLGSPISFSATPTTIRLPPPRLGDQTSEILCELGVSESIAEQLRASGAVQ